MQLADDLSVFNDIRVLVGDKDEVQIFDWEIDISYSISLHMGALCAYIVGLEAYLTLLALEMS